MQYTICIHSFPFISIHTIQIHIPYIPYTIPYIYIYIYLEPPSTEILVSDPDFNTISKRNQKNQKPNLNRFDMTPSLRCLFECWHCCFCALALRF